MPRGNIVKTKSNIFLFLLTLTAALVVFSFGYKTLKGGAFTQNTAKPQQQTVQKKSNQALAFSNTLTVNDRHILGEKDAPVTIISYEDYQCSHCVLLNVEVRPQIIKNYVETGKVKWAFRDFAFLGIESRWAAEAADCAGEQGKYWEYHDLLFDSQKAGQTVTFSKTNLKKFAYELSRAGAKFNMPQFNECLDSGKYSQEVESSTQAGLAQGIEGTPAVFINGRKLEGLHPLENYIQVIEEGLSS